MSRRITAGNDAPFRWAVKLQGKPFDLSGKDVKVYVINSRGEIPVARLTIEGHEVSGVFEGRYQTRLGEHSLVLRVNEGRPEMKTATVANVFELVQWSADAGGSDESDVIVAPVLIESEISIGGSSYDDRELREAIADLEETKVDNPVVFSIGKLGNPVYSDKDGTGWSTQQVENAFGMPHAEIYEDVKKRGVVFGDNNPSLYAFQSMEQDGRLTYCFNVSTADSKTKVEYWLTFFKTPEAINDIEFVISLASMRVDLSYDDPEVDAELSETSENPVQNKVITGVIQEIMGTTGSMVSELSKNKLDKPIILSAATLGEPIYQNETDMITVAYSREQVESALGISFDQLISDSKHRDLILDLGQQFYPTQRVFPVQTDFSSLFLYSSFSESHSSIIYAVMLYDEPTEVEGSNGVKASLVIMGKGSELADATKVNQKLTELSEEVGKKVDANFVNNAIAAAIGDAIDGGY